MCILKNDPQLVKILLDAGANINLPNNKDIYPLEIAKGINNLDIINLIRDSVKTRK
jgi:ankyrin repeat protein